MRSLAQMVLEFHKAFKLPWRTQSGRPSLATDRRALRRRLLAEEFDEYLVAEASHDIVGIADTLGDMAYIIWGTALEYGIPLDEVIAEIHRSNMSKLDENGQPIMREDGKVLKSARFTPPNIAAILERYRQA